MNYDYWRHYLRGWAFHFLGKPDVAYEAYVLAHRDDVQRVQPLRHLAAIAAGRHAWGEAAQWLAAAATIEPDNANGHFNLGFALEQNGQRRQAIAAFLRSTELNPNLDRAWYGMGMAHAAFGEHAEAAAALKKAVELQPMNGIAFYQLGMAYHHCNQPEKVRSTLERLLQFDPRHARKLVQDTERSDLSHLLPELPF